MRKIPLLFVLSFDTHSYIIGKNQLTVAFKVVIKNFKLSLLNTLLSKVTKYRHFIDTSILKDDQKTGIWNPIPPLLVHHTGFHQ
jgi:hypothetical protein